MRNTKYSRHNWRLQRLLFGICIAMSTLSFAEDPSVKSPFLPLQNSGVTSEAAPPWNKLVASDASIRKFYNRMSKGKAPNARDVGKLYVTVEQFRRWLQALEDCGEPAAIDFKYRETEYGKFLASTLTRFWSSPQSSPVRKKVVQTLQRNLPKRYKQLEKIVQRVESDPAAAEKLLDKYVDSLFATAGVLAPTEKDIAYKGLGDPKSLVRNTNARLRKESTRQQAAQSITELQNNYESLISRVAAQAEATRRGSNSSEAPQLETWIDDWKQAHLGIVRANAISQMHPTNPASGGSLNSDYESEAISRQGPRPPADTSQQYATLMLDSLVALISADAQSPCTPDKYLHYVHVLADLQLRLNDEDAMQPFSKPMQSMASQAGMLPSVSAYQAATGDLLRWRQRVAEARSRKLQTQHPDIAAISRQKMASTKKRNGLFTLKSADVPVLLKSIPALVPEVQAALGDAAVSIGHVAQLDGASQIWMSQLRDGFYARVAVPSETAEHDEVQELRFDLLAEGGSPPLSIQAAAALISAERGSYQRVGGLVHSFAIESALSRYANLPATGSNLVPIGRSLPQPAKTSPKNALALRINLVPTWLQHRYFVIEL